MPSETITRTVVETGSLMPLVTLLSARSAVARIWIGPCTVPAWNDAVAMPLTVCVATDAPVTGPLTELADRRASPFGLVTISSSTLSKPVLPMLGSGTGCPPPSSTWIVSTEFWLPPEPDRYTPVGEGAIVTDAGTRTRCVLHGECYRRGNVARS